MLVASGYRSAAASAHHRLFRLLALYSATEMDIPDTVVSVGQYAFSGCTSLHHVRLSDQITLVDQDLFSGCTSLAAMVIPRSVMCIEPYAFSGCTSLADITVQNPDPKGLSFGAGAFTDVPFARCVLHVPAGSKARYESTVPWTIFVNVR